MGLRRAWIRLVAVLMVFAMVGALAGCGGKTENKEPIKIGGIFDITGGTGDVGAPYAEGAKDFFKYLNEKGGINGRQVELIGIDYAYKIPQAVDAYNKLTKQDKVVAILGWGTGDTEAMVKFITQDKIPFISGSYSEHLLNIQTNPYNFLVAQSYSDQARMVLKWIKDNWKDGSRKPRVALVYNDSGFGKSPIEDTKKYAAENGIDLVDEEIVALTALEATSQLLNMQKKEPDFALIQETSNATATVLKDAKKLGLKTKFVGLNWAADEKAVKLAGDSAEGYLGVIPFAFPYEDVPGMKDLKEYNKKNSKNWEERNQKYVQGWVSAMVMAEGIKRAGKDITGEGIRKGLESMKNVDLGGLAAPVTFTAESHRGAVQSKLYTVKNGKFQPASDWLKAPGR